MKKLLNKLSHKLKIYLAEGRLSAEKHGLEGAYYERKQIDVEIAEKARKVKQRQQELDMLLYPPRIQSAFAGSQKNLVREE